MLVNDKIFSTFPIFGEFPFVIFLFNLIFKKQYSMKTNNLDSVHKLVCLVLGIESMSTTRAAAPRVAVTACRCVRAGGCDGV